MNNGTSRFLRRYVFFEAINRTRCSPRTTIIISTNKIKNWFSTDNRLFFIVVLDSESGSRNVHILVLQRRVFFLMSVSKNTIRRNMVPIGLPVSSSYDYSLKRDWKTTRLSVFLYSFFFFFNAQVSSSLLQRLLLYRLFPIFFPDLIFN